MSESTPVTTAAVAWDPTRPASLTVAHGPLGSSSGGSSQLHTLSALSGVGCNEYELQALLQLIQAFSDRQDKSMEVLLASYRRPVAECLAVWSEALQQREENGQEINQEINNNDEDKSQQDLDSLGINYAAMHLGSIIFPVLQQDQRQQNTAASWMMLSEPQAMDTPGLITANLVRYLRHNHVTNLGDSATELGCDDARYWPTVLALVARGCLVAAWELLAKHNMYQAALGNATAQSQDPGFVATLQEIKIGMHLLREILFQAPLPGGRTDEHDVPDLDLPNEGEGDSMSEAEQQQRLSVYLLDDLPVAALDYRIWETSSSAATTTTTDADMPVQFNPQAAQLKHQLWQDYVKDTFQLNSTLLRYMPQLQGLVQILCGDLRPYFQSQQEQPSWSEKLVAELLYRQPSIQPRYVATRARRLASPAERTSPVNTAIWNIMDGNAAEALTVLHDYGGGSGAALPATLLALLFCVFCDTAILPTDVEERKFDFITQAATAIQSSLAQTKDHDTGTQLAIRLLLPFQEEASIRTFIAEVILEHYAPTTEVYAKTVLVLVQPLVERKSLQILDACATVVLSLYRRLRDEQRMEACILILLEGLKLEQMVLPQAALGACYRTVAQLGLGSICKVLEWSLNPVDPGEVIADMAVCQAMQKVIQDHGTNTKLLAEIPECILVVHGLPLADALIASDYAASSQHLTRLLVSDVDPVTNVTIFRPTLHWHVLRAAEKCIVSEKSTLDTKGINILMERYYQLTTLPNDQKKYPADQIRAIETALAKGLAQAFCLENSRKGERKKTSVLNNDEEFEGMSTSNLHEFSLDKQERYVQRLLEG